MAILLNGVLKIWRRIWIKGADEESGKRLVV